MQERAAKAKLWPPSLPLGSVGCVVSTVDIGLDVVQYLPFNPERLCILAAIPKFEPLGKETVVLKPLDVLRAKRDQLQDSSLRFSIANTPM